MPGIARPTGNANGTRSKSRKISKGNNYGIKNILIKQQKKKPNL